jgi:preprotein translocase subunit YajC
MDISLLLPLIVLLPLLLLILRQRKTQRAFVEQQSRLAVGQDIMTTAGLYARVVEIDGDVMVLEVAPGYRVRWNKAAVGSIVTPADGASPVAPPASGPVDTTKRGPSSGA